MHVNIYHLGVGERGRDNTKVHTGNRVLWNQYNDNIVAVMHLNPFKIYFIKLRVNSQFELGEDTWMREVHSVWNPNQHELDHREIVIYWFSTSKIIRKLVRGRKSIFYWIHELIILYANKYDTLYCPLATICDVIFQKRWNGFAYEWRRERNGNRL